MLQHLSNVCLNKAELLRFFLSRLQSFYSWTNITGFTIFTLASFFSSNLQCDIWNFSYPRSLKTLDSNLKKV